MLNTQRNPTGARRRLPLAVVLGAATFGCLALLASAAASPNPPAPLARPSSAPAPCLPGDDGVKSPLRGIVTINRLPDGPDRSYVGGLSVNVPWADLQPQAGGPISRPNAIDAAIAQARAAGATPDGCPRGVKVRLLAGVRAPSWAKVLDGPALPVSLAQDDLAGTVGRFWTPAFGRAYEALQQQLAAVYDEVPEVREVVISRCTTFYAEPLLRQVGGGSERVLSAAGLDEVADRSCLMEQVDAHAMWQKTPSSLALNPYVRLSDAVGEGSLGLPLATADHCRATLQQRCILANNSIRWPPLGRKYLELYEVMSALGPPLEFQTAAPRRIGDATQTLRWALERGAVNVEIEPAVVVAAGAAFDMLAGSATWGPGR